MKTIALKSHPNKMYRAFDFSCAAFQSLDITDEVAHFYSKLYRMRKLKGPFTLSDCEGESKNRSIFSYSPLLKINNALDLVRMGFFDFPHSQSQSVRK